MRNRELYLPWSLGLLRLVGQTSLSLQFNKSSKKFLRRIFYPLKLASCLTLTKPTTASKTMPLPKVSVLSLAVETEQIPSLDSPAFITAILYEIGGSWMNTRKAMETGKESILVYVQEDAPGRCIYRFEACPEVYSIITLYFFWVSNISV